MKEKTLKSEIVYNGSIVTVRKDTILMPNGVQAMREIVDHDPAVVILPFQKPNKIYMIRQFRTAVQEDLLEIPAGMVDKGENLLEAAKRELREETGFTAQNWTLLGQGYMTPGFCNELMYFYLAEELTAGDTDFDHDELITLESYTLEEVEKMVREHRIRDGKTLTTYLLAKDYL